MTHRVVFMGTPQFAIPTLQALIDEYSSPYLTYGGEGASEGDRWVGGQVVGVVTQPDRPSGRGRKPKLSPVKVLAQRYGLPVLQPTSLRDSATLAEIQALQPDVIVVAAFGQILPPTVLDLPPAGCVNVHASLLPRWRGAAPVAAAILAGDEMTGVTLMKMDAGLDTGPILSQRSLTIAPDDTRESLTARLAQLGADLLRDTLPDWLAGKIIPHPQADELVTYAPQIKKEQGRINWSEPADVIARKVRAFYPWPGAFTTWQDRPLKILRAVPVAESRRDGIGLTPGTVCAASGGPAVVTGQGLLSLREVQPAGKRPMSVDDFTRGARDFIGDRLV